MKNEQKEVIARYRELIMNKLSEFGKGELL
jgi:hypothetical protein